MPDQFGNPLPGESLNAPMGPSQNAVPAMTIPLDPYATLPGQEEVSGDSDILNQIQKESVKSSDEPVQNNVFDYFEYMKNNPNVSYDRINADTYKAVITYGMTLKMPTKDEMLTKYKTAYETAGSPFTDDVKQTLSIFWDEVNRNYQRYTNFEFSANRSSSNIVPGSVFNDQMGLNYGPRSYDTTGQKLRAKGLEYRTLGEDTDNMAARGVAMLSNGNKGMQNGLYHKYAMDESVAEVNYKRSGKVGILDPETDELKVDEQGNVVYIPYEEGFLDDPANLLVPRTYRRDPNTGAPVLIPLDDELLQEHGIDLRRVNNLMSSWSQPEFESTLNPFSAVSHIGLGALGDLSKIAATTIDALGGSLMDNTGTSHANAMSRMLYGAGTALQGSVNADQKIGPLDNLASFGLSVGQVIQSFLPVVAASAGSGLLFRAAATPLYGEAAAAEIGAQIGAKAGLGYGAALAGESAYTEALKSGLMTEREAAAFGALNAAAVYAVSNALQAKWLESLTKSMSPQARNKAFQSVQKEIIEEMKERGVQFGNTNPAAIEKEFAKVPFQLMIKRFGETFGRLKEGVQKYWKSKDFSPAKQALLNNEGLEETLEFALQEASKEMFRDGVISNDFYKAARNTFNSDFEGFFADNKRERKYLDQLKQGRNYFSKKSFDTLFKEAYETFIVSQIGGGITTAGTNLFRDFTDEKDKQLRSAIANSILDGITPSEFIAQGDQLRKQKRLGNARLDYDTLQPTNNEGRTENDLVYRTTVDMYKKYYGIAENLGITSRNFLKRVNTDPRLRKRAQDLLERAGNGDRMHYEALQKAIMPEHTKQSLNQIVFGLEDEASAKDIRSTLGVTEEEYQKALDINDPLEDALATGLNRKVEALLNASSIGKQYRLQKRIELLKSLLKKTPVNSVEDIRKRIQYEDQFNQARNELGGIDKKGGDLVGGPSDSRILDLYNAQIRALQSQLATQDITDGTVFKNAVMDSFLTKKSKEIEEELDARRSAVRHSQEDPYINILERKQARLKQIFSTEGMYYQGEVDAPDKFRALMEEEGAKNRLGLNYDFDKHLLSEARKHHLIEGKRIERELQIQEAEANDRAIRQQAAEAAVPQLTFNEAPYDYENLANDDLKKIDQLSPIDYSSLTLDLGDRKYTPNGIKDALSILKDKFGALNDYRTDIVNRFSDAVGDSKNQPPFSILKSEINAVEKELKTNEEPKNVARVYSDESIKDLFFENNTRKFLEDSEQEALEESINQAAQGTAAVIIRSIDKEIENRKKALSIENYRDNIIESNEIPESELVNALFGAEFKNGRLQPSELLEDYESLMKDAYGTLEPPLKTTPGIEENIDSLDLSQRSPKSLLEAFEKEQFYNDFSEELAEEMRPILQAYGNVNHGLSILPKSIYEAARQKSNTIRQNLQILDYHLEQAKGQRKRADDKRAKFLLDQSVDRILGIGGGINLVSAFKHTNGPLADSAFIDKVTQYGQAVKQAKDIDKKYEAYHTLTKYIREAILNKENYTGIHQNGKVSVGLQAKPDALKEFVFSYYTTEPKGVYGQSVTAELVKILGIAPGDFAVAFNEYVKAHQDIFARDGSATLEQRIIAQEMAATDFFLDSKMLSTNLPSINQTIESDRVIVLNAPAAAGKTDYIIRDYLNIMSRLKNKTLEVVATSYNRTQSQKIASRLAKLDRPKDGETGTNNPYLNVTEEPAPNDGTNLHIKTLINNLRTNTIEPDYIVYDEITLMKPGIFKELLEVLEGKKTKLIAAGDPYQIVLSDGESENLYQGNARMSESDSFYDPAYPKNFATVTEPEQTFRFSYPSSTRFHKALEEAIRNKLLPAQFQKPHEDPFQPKYLESYKDGSEYQGGEFTNSSEIKNLAKRLKAVNKPFVILSEGTTLESLRKDPELQGMDIRSVTDAQGSEHPIVLAIIEGDHTKPRVSFLRKMRVAASRAKEYFALASTSYTGPPITMESNSRLIPFVDSTTEEARKNRDVEKENYTNFGEIPKIASYTPDEGDDGDNTVANPFTTVKYLNKTYDCQ